MLCQRGPCRRSSGLRLAQREHFQRRARRRAAAEADFDAKAFAASYAVMGAQRATKILGLFARLDKRDGKPQYLQHLPRIERRLAKNLAHPLLQPLKLWYQTHLPRALGGAVESPSEP